MGEISVVMGRTYEGLLKWLAEHDLAIPEMEEISEIVVDIIKAYKSNDTSKREELIKRILKITNCPPELATETVRQFARLASTYMTLLDIILGDQHALL